jgi:hypothetical protein
VLRVERGRAAEAASRLADVGVETSPLP